MKKAAAEIGRGLKFIKGLSALIAIFADKIRFQEEELWSMALLRKLEASIFYFSMLPYSKALPAEL